MTQNKQKIQLDKFFKKIDSAILESTSKPIYQSLAQSLIDIVVKRTRLGFGVDQNLKARSKLRDLTPLYVLFRRSFKKLDTSTRPRRSNLTLTGQMLRSVKIIRLNKSGFAIGPTGNRLDGETNQNIAQYNADMGRTFMSISLNEFNQIRRIYRKTFGDLLKKRRLIK